MDYEELESKLIRAAQEVGPGPVVAILLEWIEAGYRMRVWQDVADAAARGGVILP